MWLYSPVPARKVLITKVIEPANVLTSIIRRTKLKESPVSDYFNEGRVREQCTVVKNCLNGLSFVGWEVKDDVENICAKSYDFKVK